jgi:kynurenine formamidase
MGEDSTEASGFEANPVLGLDWHPSRWGAADQLGSGNLLGPAKVLEAASLIKTGEIVKLGYPYDANMPLSAGRSFSLRMPGGPTGGPVGKANRAIFNDDFVAADLGQVGTHMDALGHVGCQCDAVADHGKMLFYNGNSLADIWAPYGLKRLGIEQAPTFFTRGVLFDVEGLRGRCLDVGEEISVADLEACLDRQGLPARALRRGDAALIRTGHAARFMSTPKSFYDGSPGIGLEAAAWLSSQEVALVGADTYAVEVDPNPNPDVRFPCHHHLITKNGIYLHENLKLDELAEIKRFEFAYSFTPLPIIGATGSPGTPVAIF